MAKTREVTDPNEAFERLGINAPETPGGAVIEVASPQVVSPQSAKPQGTPEGTVDASTKPKEGEKTLPGQIAQQATIDFDGKAEHELITQEPPAQESTTQESLAQVSTDTQNADGTLTEAEVQRRSWQADADRAKAEAAKRDEQIRMLQEQNRQLLNVVSPFMMKYGQQQPNAPVQEVDKEPEPDFIEDGYFDPKKFAEYEKKKEDFLARRIESRVTSSWQKKQEEQTTQVQLNEVAKEFPEYVNQMTGEIDLPRLQRDLQDYTSKKTIIDLVREAKGKSAPLKQQTINPLNTQASISAIEKNANKPSSAAASPETRAREIDLPDKLRKTAEKFGGMELPPDFDGLKD